MSGPSVVLQEITSGDADRVGGFLHLHHNQRISAAAWAAVIRPPWDEGTAPNHGFMLVDHDGQIVGAYLAVYSTRDEGRLPVCNLAALCVLEDFRPQSLRLVRALLRQKGYLFTDLSPSGSVPDMNDRLGFHRLDTSSRLLVNVPRLTPGVQVSDDAADLERELQGDDAEIYRDHSTTAAAQHLLVRRGDDRTYLIYRRDRRKRLPLFASVLYVGGDRAALTDVWPAVGNHLLRKGLPFTLAERRVLGFTPAGPGRDLAQPRPKMWRGGPSGEESVDYLYSELTLLQW